MIQNTEEARVHVDTVIRAEWQERMTTIINYPSHGLGEAIVSRQIEVFDHKAWNYHIEGAPVSRDGRCHWLLDTGETFDTTLAEDERTPEQALTKMRNLVSENFGETK